MAGIVSVLFLSFMTCPVYASGKYYNIQTFEEDSLFIGDSRTVGLMSSQEKRHGELSDGYICEIGVGYNWLREASKDIKPAAQGTPLIINLGVNDLGNCGKYVEYLNEKAPEWEEMGFMLFFMTVNPVGPECATVSQTEVDSFNTRMCKSLSPEWNVINTADSLKSKGFSSSDGLHYSSDTYHNIYDIATEHALNESRDMEAGSDCSART